MRRLITSKYKLRFISILYDIHPDILVALGWKLPGPLIMVWEKVNRVIFGRAEKIVVLSEGMKRTLVEKKKVPPKKIQVIPVWGIPETAPLSRSRVARSEWNIEECELTILSSGNMGVTLPLDEILDAVGRLAGKPVRFFFTGDGPKRRQLEEWLKVQKAAQVDILPYINDERFSRLLSAADVCLVGICPGLEELAFPSRILAAMSAGRPIVVLGDRGKDPARWIEKEKCGWCAGDGRELAERMATILEDRSEIDKRGLRAREIYESRFSQAKIMDSYAELLQ